ncbi:hypothetical protein MMYC01_209396 [Madurella mycetomatis]|uniref:GP-PDE domain-containing protein n=1 Tax=Madurella mycetomatis TaxID=100816 RepID=A0A175VRB8_9PEZI|nr:hypothetical protein MMYC01_209396 [Madurella mycetomatis]
MEWCVRKDVDGVITDDPQLMWEVRKRMGGGSDGDWYEEEEGSVGKGVVVGAAAGRTRRGRSWLGALGSYVKAGLLQAATMVFVLMLWRRLDARGRNGRGREQGGEAAVHVPIKVKV